MGRYANATCYQCGIKRPVYLLKRKTIRKDSGSSGWGASFNLAKKNSLRFYTPRKRFSNVEKWFCKDNAAHGKLNYYVELEKKLAEERIKNERQRRIEIEKREQKRLDEQIRKEEIRTQQEQEKRHREKLAKQIKLKNYNQSIKEKIVNLLNKDNRNFEFDHKSLKDVSSLIVDYRFANILKIKKISSFLRFHFIPSLILIPLSTVAGFGDNDFVKFLLGLNIFLSPFLFIASFLYKRSEKKLIKNFESDLNKFLPKIFSKIMREDFHSDISNLHQQNQSDPKHEYNFIRIIYEELGIFEIEEPTDVNLYESESASEVNLKQQSTAEKKESKKSKDEITKQKLTEIIFREDFFELCIAYFATKVVLADDKIDKEEEEHLQSFFKGFTQKEYDIVLLLQKEFNDEIICDILKKRFGSNVTLFEDLINNLFGVSESNGEVSEVEVKYIEKIATYLGLTKEQFESIKNQSNSETKKKDDAEFNYNEETFDDIDDIVDEE